MSSKKDIINNIEKFKRRIREHEEKIRDNPGDRTISHWQKEIANFEREIGQLERELNTVVEEAYCPKCKRTTSLRGNKCNNCGLAIA